MLKGTILLACKAQPECTEVADRQAAPRMRSAKVERRNKSASPNRGPGKKQPAPNEQQSKKERSKEGAQEPISRKQLLEKALEIIASDLNLERDKRPSNTITSLVQLLKLDRSIQEDEEQPHEIRVVWQEMDDETENDSVEQSPET